LTAADRLDVGLVGKPVWGPLLAAATDGLRPEEARWTAAILAALHNRHAGITPVLACDLARLVATAQPHPDHAPGPWGAVFDRIGRAGRETADIPTPRRTTHGYGLLLHAHPSYTILRVALPVVAFASAQRVGRCLLFAEGAVEDGATEEEYTAYAAELTKAIVDLARTGNAPLFWDEMGLTLLSLSQAGPAGKRASSTLPEADAPGLGMLLGLQPAEMPPDAHVNALQRLPLPVRQRVSRRSREGGYSGVYVSRRLEDLDHMLLSEYQQPDPLLADRILNTGFLALERQPKREKRRDLLLAALLPCAPDADISAAFLKACWFQAVLRLSLILRQHQLNQTEFRWIEGDALGRSRVAVFRLEDLPQGGISAAAIADPAVTRAFLNALHWLPTYLDTRAAFHVPDQREAGWTDGARGPVDEALWWSWAAWYAQQRPGSAAPLDVDDFGIVHAMVCLPGALVGAESVDGLSALARMRGGLRFGDTLDRNASLTWVPGSLCDVAGWRYTGSGATESRLYPGAEYGWTVRPTETDIAARLIRRWLRQWVKEIWRA
jgi:hypothetical protein